MLWVAREGWYVSVKRNISLAVNTVAYGTLPPPPILDPIRKSMETQIDFCKRNREFDGVLSYSQIQLGQLLSKPIS